MTNTLEKPNMISGIISPEAKFGYIPGLDGIRAIAVTMVIVAHLGLGHLVPGGFGVTLFFFVSGFLITRLLLAEQGKKGQVQLGQFYIRRFLRLLPALYVMLLVTWPLLVYTTDVVPPLREIVTSFTYTGNVVYIWRAFQPYPLNLPVARWDQLWSLAVEEHFYLLFPLVIIAFRKAPQKAVVACLAIVVLGLGWRLTTYYGFGWPHQYNYVATDARLDSIVWGCLLSLALHAKPQSLRWLIGWGPMIASVVLLLIGFGLRDEGFRQTFRYSLQGAALFIGVLNLYFWPNMKLVATDMLEIGVISWVGRISYGLYLWHMPAMQFSQKWFGLGWETVPWAAVALVLTIVPTVLSYYLIEQPIISLRRKFGSHVVKGSKRVSTTT